MRRVAVDQLQPGMVTAKTIFSADGLPLIVSGMAIKPQFIERLRELGVFSVFVEDQQIPETPPEVVTEETRRKAIAEVYTAFQDVKWGRGFQLQRIRDIVNDLINDLLQNPTVLFHLTDIRTADNYTFAHSVGVCLLSLMMGISLGLAERELKNLGIGALLHDIGKVAVDEAIINKPGILTNEEMAGVRRHPLIGYEIVVKAPDIAPPSARVVLEHHEKLDGSGYPQGLMGAEIHDFSKIVTVADIYDALTSDRVYRPRFPPYQAVEILLSMAGTALDKDLVKILMENIAIYPVGSIVRLSTGERGIVIRVDRTCPAQPLVRIVADPAGNPLSVLREVDLSRGPGITLTYIVEENE